MERTNFEKLQVYQLSEKIADSIWNIVITWDSLAKDTVENRSFDLQIALEQT